MLHFEVQGYDDSDADATMGLVAGVFKDAPYAGRILLSRVSSRVVDLIGYHRGSVLRERVIRVYGHEPDLQECGGDMMTRFKPLRAVVEIVKLEIPTF